MIPTGTPASMAAARESSESFGLGLEVDHVFVVVSRDAPERAALERAGLRVGWKPFQHTGQGTSSIVLPVRNAYLELLWPDERVSVAPGMEHVAEEIDLRRAWRTSKLSPFGIGLRRRAGTPTVLPFSTTAHTADWMRPGTAVEMLNTPEDALAPDMFVVPSYMAISEAVLEQRIQSDPAYAARFAHPLGVKRLTAVCVTVSDARGVTQRTALLSRSGIVSIEHGDSPLLSLTFDEMDQGGTRDLRPDLPLLLRF